MKKLFFLTAIFLVMLSFVSHAQIKVNNSGFVGINNTNPAYRLDVNGTFQVKTDVTSGLRYEYGELYHYPYGTGTLGGINGRWSTLYVYEIASTHMTLSSDINLKKDISNITSAKKSILALNPIRYKYDASKEKTNNPDVLKKEFPFQYGFSAQEVEKIFPDIVTKQEDGTLGIRYIELIPLLVQSLKEQQVEIDELRKKLESIESSNSNKKEEQP